MAASATEINNYIDSVRTAVSDFGDRLALKQRLGHTDIYCDKVRLMLLSAYMDCINDYFLQDDYENNNFFTNDEIMDVMQHINSICKTNYILSNL